VVLAFPNKVEVDVAERDRELQHYGYDPAWFDMGAPYVRLRDWATRRGVPFVYPLADFEAAAKQHPLFFARDGHPNGRGHALAAAAVEPRVREALAHGAWHATRR
jgi:hypothetical protein